MKKASRSIGTLAAHPGSVNIVARHATHDPIYVNVPVDLLHGVLTEAIAAVVIHSTSEAIDLLESAGPLIAVIRNHVAVGERSPLRVEELVDDHRLGVGVRWR